MNIPFEITKRMVNGGWHEAARFVCSRCGAHADLPLIRTRASYNPEATVTRAAQAGWGAKKNSTRVECPSCASSRDTRSAGESPGPKKQAEVIMSQPKEVSIAEPTKDQRLRIRALLDKHFDDGVGQYLDGFSDQKVAAEVNVPRLTVERIRESGWGPIKVPPEMAAAEKSVSALELRCQAAERLLGDMQACIDTARREVSAARKALGIPA